MTYALTAPPFVLSVITMLFNGFHSDRRQERYLHIVVPLCVTLVANVVAVSTANVRALRGHDAAPGLLLRRRRRRRHLLDHRQPGAVQRQARHRAHQRRVQHAQHPWGGYLYHGSPRYVTAFIVNMAATGLAIAFAAVTRIWLRRLNAKLDGGEDCGKHGPTRAHIAGGFRYLV